MRGGVQEVACEVFHRRDTSFLLRPTPFSAEWMDLIHEVCAPRQRAASAN
jgi:hypothetical protein